MRLVIDTNVIFSALYRPASHPGKLLLLALEGRLDLFAPDTVRQELERVLRRKLDYSEAEWRITLEALPITWIERGEYADFLHVASQAISDPSDAPLIAAALLVQAAVVSGDQAFHPLKRPVVRTWKPREAVETSTSPRRKRSHRRRTRKPGHRA